MANERGPRVRTARQLANDEKMRQAAAETKRQIAALREAQMSAAGGVAVAEEEATAPETRIDEEYDFVAAEDLFGTAANLFQRAATEGRLTRAETAQLEGILSKIDPMKNPEIADNAAVQAFLERMAERKAADPGVRPGELVGTGLAATRKPWTHAAVMQRMLEWINTGQGETGFRPQTFTPNQSRLLIWNGLAVRVYADEEATVPECYFEIYRNMQVGVRSAQQHAELMFRQRGGIDPRVADVTIMGNATARVRGNGMGATYLPGEGGFDVGEDVDAG